MPMIQWSRYAHNEGENLSLITCEIQLASDVPCEIPNREGCQTIYRSHARHQIAEDVWPFNRSHARYLRESRRMSGLFTTFHDRAQPWLIVHLHPKRETIAYHKDFRVSNYAEIKFRCSVKQYRHKYLLQMFSISRQPSNRIDFIVRKLPSCTAMILRYALSNNIDIIICYRC